MTGGPGPVALVGSGEFLPVMEPVDAGLLEGRPRRAVVLPTAAAREGDARVSYWLELGRAHYEAMGVEPVLLDVRTRADARRPRPRWRRVEGAGLVYLSGGDPHHLAGHAARHGPVARHRGGLAGRDGPGGMLSRRDGTHRRVRPTTSSPPAVPPGVRPSTPGSPTGWAWSAGLAVIPHFDQMERLRPGALEWFASWQPAGTTLVGVEEETALVAAGGRWQVQGSRGGVGPRRRASGPGSRPATRCRLPHPTPVRPGVTPHPECCVRK